MEKQGWKRWELALIVGLLTGMLITPAGAEGTVLSRWPAGTPGAELRYQVTLFPFSVGELAREAASVPTKAETPELQVKFRLVERCEEIQAAIGR